jgi:hypothetical protein
MSYLLPHKWPCQLRDNLPQTQGAELEDASGGSEKRLKSGFVLVVDHQRRPNESDIGKSNLIHCRDIAL